jgi:F0F1-type ATP synthase assembly protein I
MFSDKVFKMTNEENTNEITSNGFWRNLAVRYWYLLLIFGLITVGAIIGFILTLDWYVDTSTIGGNGSWTFDQFSLGTAVEWIIFLILWELLIVVLPTLGGAGILIAIIWFGILPPELKKEIKTRSKTPRPGKRSGGGGGFGFLLFIGVCIYVFIDGNWQTEFGSLSYGYFIDAYITVLTWGLIIFGIPVAIIGIIWLTRKYGISDSTASLDEVHDKDTQ